MLKAGALLFSLGIALILALISGSIVLYSYYNKLEIQEYILIQKADINVVSAINYLVSADGISVNQRKMVDLFGNGNDTVDVEMNSWGMYNIAKAHAKVKRFNFYKTVLVGNKVNPEERVALYLADNNRPLSLAGKTYISGMCYLPKAGVKPSYIEGQNFSGKNLINGEIKQSAQHIPKPDKSLIDAIVRQSFNNQNEGDSVLYWDESMNSPIINSFDNVCLVIESNSAITLKQNVIKGHVKIFSDKEITVSGNCLLEDVILVAPKIHIEDGFKGIVQCLASDSIILGKDCSLNYPSSLSIIRDKEIKHNAFINLSSGCIIEGDVFIFDAFELYSKSVLLKIEKDSEILGNVYSSGIADIRGTISGEVMINKIVLSTLSSTYENQLLNATIDAAGLSQYFVGGIWQTNGSPEIIKTLY